MKATGIVRRVDELGRIVIPKEIRRNMGITMNTPVEIFTENDSLCIRRYKSNNISIEFENFMGVLAEIKNDYNPEQVLKLNEIEKQCKEILKNIESIEEEN